MLPITRAVPLGLIGLLLVGLVMGACASTPARGDGASNADIPGFIVVTTGGTALADGDTEVPPTLDLRVGAGRPLSSAEVPAALDGTPLNLRAVDGGALVSTIAPLALGSAHRLELTLPGRGDQQFRFHVVAPAAAHAAVHRDPAAGTVLDVAFALAPDRAAVAAVVPPGGAVSWVDARHLRVAWTQAPGQAITLPASIGTARGSHLAGDLRMALDRVAAGTLRSADVPAAGTRTPAPEVVAFGVGTTASRASARDHAAQISVLSPTGLVANADGSLSGAPDAGDVSAARTPDSLMPVVQQLDATAAAALAVDPAAATRLAAALRGAAAAGGWGGIQLDVESLPASAAAGYGDLVTKVATALHADHRRLAVDVVPHRPGHLTASSEGYDLTVIGGAADAVVLMAYEEHGPGTAPGPVAGLSWQRELLAGSLGELGPHTRVLLGLPLYARSWPLGGGDVTADSYASAVGGALSVSGARVDYDFAAATPFIEAAGTVTFFDDAASLARKVELAGQAGLAGVALWRLGFEDPGLWQQLPAPAVRAPG